MRKFLIAAAILLGSVAYGQHNEVLLIREKDDMTGEITTTPNRKIVLLNSEGTKGFSVLAYISKDMQLQHLAVMSAGLGVCTEKGELILLLEEDNRIQLKAWSKFNCEGVSYFALTEEDVRLLSRYPLVKIRFTNGKTFEQHTGQVPSKDVKYFITIIKQLE
jgi:hypothetical protein